MCDPSEESAYVEFENHAIESERGRTIATFRPIPDEELPQFLDAGRDE